MILGLTLETNTNFYPKNRYDKIGTNNADFFVGLCRLELQTSSMSTKRSNQLSYKPK